MKFNFTFFLSVLFISVYGQITLTNKLLPAVGDSLYYATDSNAVGVTITPAGINQSWDFHQLNPIGSRSDVYRNPSQGVNFSSFASADVLLTQGLTEYYYKLFPTRLDLMGTGLRSGFPIPGINGVNVYPKQVIEQRYPQHYLDTLSYLTKTSVAFPSSIIPDTILKSLPLVPDSIRIVYNTRVRKETDSWGTVILPARSWDVLREKRLTVNQVTLEAKVPFLGWIDVTTLIGASFPQLFGTFKSYSYAFLSNETKGLITLINVDSLDNVQNVEFKPDAKIILLANNLNANHTISVFPNPASSVIYFSAGDLKPDNYFISVFDLQGKQFLSGKVFISENPVNKLDISNLSEGSYFLQLSDTKKQKFSSGVFQKK